MCQIPPLTSLARPTYPNVCAKTHNLKNLLKAQQSISFIQTSFKRMQQFYNVVYVISYFPRDAASTGPRPRPRRRPSARAPSTSQR